MNTKTQTLVDSLPFVKYLGCVVLFIIVVWFKIYLHHDITTCVALYISLCFALDALLQLVKYVAIQNYFGPLPQLDQINKLTVGQVDKMYRQPA